MNNKIKLATLSACVLSLTACTSVFEEQRTYYQGYRYDQSSSYSGNVQGADAQQAEDQEAKRPVAVPNSYHVNEYQAPASHKSRDKSWVNSQNPMGYTVEVGDDENAASVASSLQTAPKNNRSAQIKYQKDGKTYYKGDYGSYDNYQDAKKALDSLPADVKARARVKNWGTVQGGVNR